MNKLETKRRLMILFHRLGKLNAALDFAALPRSEFTVLETVERYQRTHPEESGMQVSRLIRVLQNVPSSVSRSMKRLEEKGYIERTVDKADRRNVYVQVTEAGSRVREAVKEQIDGFAERVIARMGSEEMDRMLSLWERFVMIAGDECEMMSERRTRDDV